MLPAASRSSGKLCDSSGKAPGCPVGASLVYEHVFPISLLIRDLLADVPPDTQTLLARLEQHTDRVIITKQENALLDEAGMRSARPDPQDRWSRYRHAGLDPSTFKPWQP